MEMDCVICGNGFKRLGSNSRGLTCSKDCSDKLYKKNQRKHYQENKEKYTEATKRNRELKPERYWASNTLKLHRAKGHAIIITIDELHNKALDTQNCEICDIELKYRAERTKPYGATLDRSDNGNEIRIDNIAILCRRCNTTKLDRTLEEFYEYCKKFVGKFEKWNA